jgi:putative inorganic carbon (HCO3(-)) transporter
VTIAGPQGALEVAGQGRRPRSKGAWPFPLLLLFLLWVLVLYEPDVWIASQGALVARKLPLALYALLAVFAVLRALDASLRVWFLPFLVFVINGSVTVPFAENAGVAADHVWKTLLLFYCLAVGSLLFIKSIEKTRLLLVLFLCQFSFWGVQALSGGAPMGSTTWAPIPWHPILGNTDAFAPLMVLGMVFSYYYGMATRSKRMRWLAFVTGFLCVIGIVASFTRGASLAAGLMVLYVFLRSPNRGKAAVWLTVAAAVFLIATNIIYPEGEFWTRLGTITSEGTHSGTGADRWNLWRLGWRVFSERPIFGVGAGNFGVYAFFHIPPDDMLGRYAANQWAIYGRVLHSVHMQVLVEFGLVGVATYVWMLVDFWKRNAALRSQAFILAWSRATRGQLDLRSLSLGLEGAMIAFLITGIFYDQLFVHWLYSLLTINAVLHAAVKRAAVAPPGRLAGASG